MNEKPQTSRPKLKMVKLPAAVHGMLLEVRRMMGEAGQMAVWMREDGSIVHGLVSKAPLHVVIAFALQNVAEAHNADREGIIAGFEARRDYLAGFEEKQED